MYLWKIDNNITNIYVPYDDITCHRDRMKASHWWDQTSRA